MTPKPLKRSSYVLRVLLSGPIMMVGHFVGFFSGAFCSGFRYGHTSYEALVDRMQEEVNKRAKHEPR